MGVTHTFVSTKPVAADPTQVGSAEWNAEHTVSIANADVAADAAIAESKLALNNPTHAALTLDTANGLSLVGQALSLGLASNGVTGALSGTDWSTFNGKQSALTFPLAPNLGGTGVDNGTNALTVPATGTAALLATANVFTLANTFPRINLPNTSDLNNGVIYKDTNRFIHAYGTNNLFIGELAGNFTTSGTGGNTGVGYRSLINIQGGLNNLCFGSNTGTGLTVGSNNTFVGASSGADATSSGNVGVGTNTLRVVTANYNTVIGYGSAYNLANATRNIFLGTYAGFRQTDVNYLFVVDSTQRADAATEAQNCYLYGSMTTAGFLQVNIPATTNNAVVNVLKLQSYISTASTGSANGFGTGISLQAETATDATYQQQGLISTAWVDATNATRKAALSLSAYDTAQRTGLIIEANGASADIRLLGDTWWEGEGFGLPYGSFYGNEINFSAAVNNSYAIIADTDCAEGQSNLMTYTDAGTTLTTIKAGRYLCTWYVSAESSTANIHILAGLMVDSTTTLQAAGQNHLETTVANRQLAMGGSAILDLAAGAVVGVGVGSDANITITVDHVGLTMTQIGGT